MNQFCSAGRNTLKKSNCLKLIINLYLHIHFSMSQLLINAIIKDVSYKHVQCSSQTLKPATNNNKTVTLYNTLSSVNIRTNNKQHLLILGNVNCNIY